MFHSNYTQPYLAPFLRYSEILIENRRFEPITPLFGAPTGGARRRQNFAEIFGI